MELKSIKDFYYHEKTKTALWIAGYDSHRNPLDIINSMTENTKRFMTEVGINSMDNIDTDIIAKSRRFKHTRYFAVKCDMCPKNAIVLHTSWDNIYDFIHD